MINIEAHDKVALVRLDHKVTNAIGPEMITALQEAMREVNEKYLGMVLAGGSKFFSIGLDLPQLLNLNRHDMTDFWMRFENLVLDLYTLSMPTVAAIHGHAPAGGLILAMACDYRLAGKERKVLGLNEVKIGLGVPFLAHLILEQIVGGAATREIELEGKFYAPDQALAMGLLDSLETVQDLEKAAIAKIAPHVALPKKGFVYSKHNRTNPVVHQFMALRDSRLREIIDGWFDPEVQKVLHEAAKKF